MYLIGEFQDKDAAVTAIRTLKSRGIGPGALDLFSEEPVDLPRGLLERPSRMSLASVCGAVLFGGAATAFIWWAQNSYPLPTGGMPLFSFWATGVITYEMTMLGAIVTIFAWFLWESGLLRRRGRTTPVPAVEHGSLCLRVRCEGSEADRADDAMRYAGAIDVRRFES